MRRPYWFDCPKCKKSIYTDGENEYINGMGQVSNHKCYEVKNV
jgi:hypothetical protein